MLNNEERHNLYKKIRDKMNNLLKKSLIFIMLVSIHLPAFGYKWTIYNGLGTTALVQTNVSAQVMRQVVPAKSNAVFDYDKWGGWHNILWMGGLCLTTIYAQPMGETEMKKASLKLISKSQLTGILVSAGITGGYGALGVPALFATLANPEVVVGALIVGAIIAIIAAAIVLPKLCNSGSWLITKDKEGKMHAITVRT